MKPDTEHHVDDAIEAGRKRRFRFSRRSLDAQLQQVDELAATADQLQMEAVPATLGSASAATAQTTTSSDEVASAAALQALAALDQRLRAEPMAGVAPHADVVGPGESNLAVVPAAPRGNSVLSQMTTPTVQPAMNVPDPEVRMSSTPSRMSSFDAVGLDQPGQQDAFLVPTGSVSAAREPLGSEAPPQRTGMLVDVNRIIRMLEEEAEAARARIDHELGRARDEADSVVRNANADADHIREHAQQQARVLLGEVEEIITDSQRTGQQILRKADEDAEAIRRKAGDLVLNAEDEARRIIDTARREGEQILAEQRRLATLRAQEAMREQDRLQEQIQRLEERRRQVLESLEPLIDQLSQMIPASRNVVDFPAGGASAARR